MKVNKEIFYHAYSGEKVNVGDILVFNSDTHNKMYDQVYNNEYKIDGIDANELLINKKRNNDKEFSVDEFELVLNTINNDAFALRELALEEVRSSKYPSYPSRLSCLYVTKTKEEAINWTEILKRNKKECTQILALELTGEIFCFDGNLMKRHNVSYQKHLENAELYWNSIDSNNSEIIFYGEAKVIEKEEVYEQNISTKG